MSKDGSYLGPEAGVGSQYGISRPPPPGGMALPGMASTIEPSMGFAPAQSSHPPTAPTNPGPATIATTSGQIQPEIYQQEGAGELPPTYAHATANAPVPGGYPAPVASYQAGYPPQGYSTGGQQPGYPPPTGYPQAGAPDTNYPPKGYIPPTSYQAAPVIVVPSNRQRDFFRTTNISAAEATRTWGNGMCGCCSDMSVCLLASFCGCYVIGKNAEALGESFFPYCCISLLGIGRLVVHTILRGRIREARGIKGSPISDFCEVCWCACCTLIQETKELKLMEEDAEQTIARE